MSSAEWICTKCNTTNRILVKRGSTKTLDRCVTCHARYSVEQGNRPVRWEATAIK